MKECKETRYAVRAMAKAGRFVHEYKSIFRRRKDAEAFAEGVKKALGDDYTVQVLEFEVDCLYH